MGGPPQQRVPWIESGVAHVRSPPPRPPDIFRHKSLACESPAETAYVCAGCPVCVCVFCLRVCCWGFDRNAKIALPLQQSVRRSPQIDQQSHGICGSSRAPVAALSNSKLPRTVWQPRCVCKLSLLLGAGATRGRITAQSLRDCCEDAMPPLVPAGAQRAA